MWIGSSRSQILCRRSCGNVCVTQANVALLWPTTGGQRPDREKTYLLIHHVLPGFQCTRSRYTRALLAHGSHGTIGLDYQSPLLNLVAGTTNGSWTSKPLNTSLVGCSCTARKPGLSCARAERSHRVCQATHRWFTIPTGYHGAIGSAATEVGADLACSSNSEFLNTNCEFIWVRRCGMTRRSLLQTRKHPPHQVWLSQ